MHWNEAFDQTLKDFKISAKWLSKQTGISETFISQFRKGHKDATTNVLGRLLKPLSREAKEQFFAFVLGTSLPEPESPPIEWLLESLPKEQKKKLAIQLIESIAKEPEQLEECLQM